jgi:hypothetical protein
VTNSASHNCDSQIYTTKNTEHNTTPNCGVGNCNSLSTSAIHFSLLWLDNYFDTPQYCAVCKTDPLSTYPSHMLVCLSAETQFWPWYSPRYHPNFVSNHIPKFLVLAKCVSSQCPEQGGAASHFKVLSFLVLTNQKTMPVSLFGVLCLHLLIFSGTRSQGTLQRTA